MTSSKEGMTEESSDETIGNWPGFKRRSLLKALGVGAAISTGSGVATARGNDDHDDADSDSNVPRPPHLESYYGFATPDAEEVPEYLEPDHEVELHTDLPADLEDPDHPPFFHFEPSGIHVAEDDIVQFTLKEPDHTITAYHPAFGFQQRVPDKVPPFSSPVLNVGGAWLYQLEQEGLYDLYCGPHHVLGMSMRIVVGDLDEDDVPDYEDTFEGSEDPMLFAPFSKEFLEHELNVVSEENEDCEWPWLTPKEVLDAPALDPENIQDEESVSFEDVLDDIDRFPDELPEHDKE